MIRLALDARDLARMRFGYSPLTETGESLYMLSSGRLHPLQRPWYDLVRDHVGQQDTALLRGMVPPYGYIADFFLDASSRTTTAMADQLERLCTYPPERFRHELEEVWQGNPMPRVVQEVVRDGANGVRRVADALWEYWRAALEPYWPRIRSLLEADVAYRASRLTHGGLEALMADLHPNLSWSRTGSDPVQTRAAGAPEAGYCSFPVCLRGPTSSSAVTIGTRRPSPTVRRVWAPSGKRRRPRRTTPLVSSSDGTVP